MKLAQALASGFLILSACTKTEKIVETRQAAPNARESFIQGNQKTLSLKSSALGKVFMLVANSKTTGQQPVWVEHPIKLISFEKSGTQVGLFEVSYPQIYSSLAAQKLLQSFEVVSETPDQVVINIEKGFTTLNSVESFEVMRPDRNQEAMKLEGNELGAGIKDLLVKSVEIQDDKVRITQVSRVQRSLLMAQTQRKNKSDTKTQDLVEVENSLDTRIDIFPYIENKNFKPKEQDPDWTIGMFISRVLKDASNETEALANRWDTTQPIRYVITGNTPKEALPYIMEGLAYWNRVAGREIVQVEVSEQLDVDPANGTVVVRWIPWKDAGFAYASIQQNPITGEIIRGQIYLTSSWLDPENMEASIKSTNLVMGNNACGISASVANDISILSRTVGKGTQKAVFDYLRLVVAHEAGHTLGMRHNFSGTSQAKASFEEIQQATEAYRKDPNQAVQYPEFSVSVMDYLLPLDSAITGNSVSYRVFSYDKDLIDWAYNGKDKLSSPAGAFCTDDHLLYAREENISIFGCDRFKNVGSPVLAQLEAVIQKDEQLIEVDVKTIRDNSISEDGKFTAPAVGQYYGGVAAYRIARRSSEMDNLLFSIKNEEDDSEENVILLPQEVTQILLNKLGSREYTSNEVREKIAEQFKQITDVTSRQSLILPMDTEGVIDMNWAKNQLKKIDLKKYQEGKTSSGVEYKLSDEEFAQLQVAIQDTIRYDQKAKLLHSALRLLVNKEDIKSSLMTEKDASEKKVSVSYRKWVANSKIKSLLKSYVEQLLGADLGNKKIAEIKSQTVYGKFYVINKSAFEALQSALQESDVTLEIPLASVVAKRTQDISTVLSSVGVTLNPVATPEEQIKMVDDSVSLGLLDFDLADWVKTELELSKALLLQEKL